MIQVIEAGDTTRILTKTNELYADMFLGKLIRSHAVNQSFDGWIYIVGLPISISKDVEAQRSLLLGRASLFVPRPRTSSGSAEFVLVFLENMAQAGSHIGYALEVYLAYSFQELLGLS